MTSVARVLSDVRMVQILARRARSGPFSTRVCIGGPTGAFIVILYGIGAQYGLGNLAICTVMAGVFLAFAVSPVTNTRQFGVGLTVAVLLDATVVRLILLPALIKLFGEIFRVWPALLASIVPALVIGATELLVTVP